MVDAPAPISSTHAENPSARDVVVTPLEGAQRDVHWLQTLNVSLPLASALFINAVYLTRARQYQWRAA